MRRLPLHWLRLHHLEAALSWMCSGSAQLCTLWYETLTLFVASQTRNLFAQPSKCRSWQTTAEDSAECAGVIITPQQTLTLFHNQIVWPDISPRILLVSFKWKSYSLCSASYDVSLLHPGSEGPMALWDQLLLFAQPSDGSLDEKDEDSVHTAIYKPHRILIGIVKWRCLVSGQRLIKGNIAEVVL